MPNPIQLDKAKRLASQFYANQHQQGNQQQQQQLPPQNQIQQPALDQQQPAPVQQEQNQHQNHPILRNVVQLPENAVLNVPTEAEIATTYNQIGVVLEEKQRADVISASRKLFTTQEELAQKVADMEQRPERRKTVTPAEAVKLSDASLIKHFGEYQGEGIDQYLYLRYSLISNKYYAVLPKDASFKLSREEIISRLARLYGAEPDQRNAELISFYENLVRVKDFEASAKEAPAAAEVVANAHQITDEERRSNEKVFAKNEQKLMEGVHDVNEWNRRLTLMQNVMKHGQNPDENFLAGSAIPITAEMKEGIRQCLAWMYRNSCKTSHSKLAFVHKLASSAPEKILLALYLVEKGKQDAPDVDDFYKATHGYVPNYAAFKGKLVASRFKFWKRLGKNSQDDVVNWGALGAAVRYATSGTVDTPSDLDKFTQCTSAISRFDNEINNDEDNSVEKRDHMVQRLEQKGNLILTYYRSAGLKPDMPVDMLPNREMRAEVTNLLQQITDEMQQIRDLTANLPEENAADPIQYDNMGDAQKEQKLKGPDEPSSIISLLDTAMKPIKVISSANSGMGVARDYNDSVENLVTHSAYNNTFLALGGVSAVIGAILAIKKVVGVAKSASGLSLADHVAQALDVSGGLVNSLGIGTVAGTKITTAMMGITDVHKAPPHWYGTTQVKSVGDSFNTVSGGIQFVAGCVSIAAGTVMTTAGAIQLGRYKSSRKDLENVDRALKAKNAPLSPEQQKLRRFMNHQNRMVSMQGSSATMQTISGITTLIGGVLTVSGIFAPIGVGISILSTLGNVGFGIYQSRVTKKKAIKETVDENLNITAESVRQAKETNPALQNKSDSDVRDIIRQETMGALGFANYKQCYAHFMKEFALMLYDTVMNKDRNNEPDWDIYHNALKSLGMHMDIQKKKPTASAIYSKLMK